MNQRTLIQFLFLFGAFLGAAFWLSPDFRSRVTPEDSIANSSDFDHNNETACDHQEHSHPMTTPVPEAVIVNRLAASQQNEWKSLIVGDVFHLDVFPGGTSTFVVDRVGQADVGQVLNAHDVAREGGFLTMTWRGANLVGLIQIPSRNLAYTLRSESGQDVVVTETLLSRVVCVQPLDGNTPARRELPVEAGLPRPTNRAVVAWSLGDPRVTSIPVLRSRPSASAAIYLDFDGETVQDGFWANGALIQAPAARLNDSQILEVWRRVVADFEMFDVNVTTVLSDYNNAPNGLRTHCIITANDAAAPGAGGVAYIDSFKGLYSRYCWAFIDDEPKACAEVISHEVGHTLGLFHDGRSSPPEEYYAGHGTGPTGWAPIMGVGYYRELVQWSRGEYLSANNQQNDLAIIASTIAYLADDHGNSTGTASTIVGASAPGRIGQTNDIDMFSVSLSSGVHTIYLQPENFSNLDALLEVLNSAGALIATSNPPDAISCSASFHLDSTQTVFLRVRGTGKGSVTGTGYSNYGCLGSYVLFGFGDQQQPPSAPVGLTIRRLSGSQLQLLWQASLGADVYDVYRDGEFLTTTSATDVIDVGLIPGATYFYQVLAGNEYGYSGFSEPATITMPGADEFVMDGNADFPGYLVSNPGMVIYAAVRGNRLYISTWSPGSNGSGFGSDHHLFVSDQLLASATTPAPWAKRGFIAIPGNKPYLAGESSSTYAGWFNTSGATTLFKPPVNSLQMEGSLDLVEEFGSVPEVVYVAAVAYQTDDANINDAFLGRINAQAPVALVANDNLEPGEFLAIPVARIRDAAQNGTYDILSPDRDFVVRDFRPDENDRPRMSWHAVPGATFTIYRQTNLLGQVWQWAGTQSSGSTQWDMTFVETNAGPALWFYRISHP